MSGFSALKFSQKLLLGGIMGTCGGIFMFNGASGDLQRRRFRDAEKLVRSGEVPREAFRVINGQLDIPPELQKACKSFEPSPFLENTWTPSFVRNQLSLNLTNWDEGRKYTMFTSGFNHAGPGHLLFNMLALFSVAPMFMLTQGTTMFLGIWATSAVAGGLPTLWTFRSRLNRALQADPVDKESAYRYTRASAIGASASIMGLFGASAVLFPQIKWQIMFIPYGIPARTLLGFTLVGSILADAAGWFPGVGHWGHIGGMVNGVIFGVLLSRRQKAPGVAGMVAVLTCATVQKSNIIDQEHLGDPI